ncbi:MAG: LapA family protein [Nitrospina sp.]|nr:LapA family protein [Nitrospina sp.]
MSPFKFILLIIVTLIVVVFAVKNMELVEVSFYDFYLNSHNIKVPLLVVILGSMAFGFSIAWLSGWMLQIRLKALIHRKDKTIEELQSKLNEYKPKPPPGKTLEAGDFPKDPT